MASSPSRWSLWVPVVLYLAGIFVLSSVSDTPSIPVVTDKDLHGLLYFGLGVLLTRALSSGFWRPVRLGTAFLVTALASLYGMSDELHQYFVPPRQVEGLDVIADTIGAATAAFGLYAWGIIRFRNAL